MLSIATTFLRIPKETNMLIKSNWLVFLSNLRRVMPILGHLQAYWLYNF